MYKKYTKLEDIKSMGENDPVILTEDTCFIFKLKVN